MASRRKIVRGVAGILLLLCTIAVTLDGRPRAAEGAPPTVQVREVFFGEREETVCQPGRREFLLDAAHVRLSGWPRLSEDDPGLRHARGAGNGGDGGGARPATRGQARWLAA